MTKYRIKEYTTNTGERVFMPQSSFFGIYADSRFSPCSTIDSARTFLDCIKRGHEHKQDIVYHYDSSN